MIGEANILAAFWQRNRGRFCELTDEEIKRRSGFEVTSDEFKTLTGRGHVTHEFSHSTNLRLYRLTRSGEAAVSAMIVMGTLPKLMVRLTAVPQDEGCKNNRRA